MIRQLISQGENAAIEFKSMEVSAESLGKEIIAFLNTYGGNILVGVEDDGTITGIDNSKNWETWVTDVCRDHINPPIASIEIAKVDIDKKIVLNIVVPKGINKPYHSNKNQYYIRVGSTNRVASQPEILRMFQQAGVFHFDATIVQNSLYTDLDLNRLNAYFKMFDIDISKEQNLKSVLKNVDVMDENEEHLTVSGCLMFGTNPQKYLQNASITFARFNGLGITDELIDSKVIEGTLDNQVDNCVSTIKSNILVGSSIVGTRRMDNEDVLSDKVWRELIVNAVVHRDYSILGSGIRVFQFQDRIEVRSPGRLPNSVDTEKIKYGVSYARNPVLVKFMQNLRYIDKMGRGIPMIINEVREKNKKITFEEVGEELVATLFF